jgi:hypothetical protein
MTVRGPVLRCALRWLAVTFLDDGIAIHPSVPGHDPSGNARCFAQVDAPRREMSVLERASYQRAHAALIKIASVMVARLIDKIRSP